MSLRPADLPPKSVHVRIRQLSHVSFGADPPREVVVALHRVQAQSRAQSRVDTQSRMEYFPAHEDRMRNITAGAVRILILISIFLPLTMHSERHPQMPTSVSYELDDREFRKSWVSDDPRKACSEFYPPPAGSDSWNGCEDKGRSQCGGPQECGCGKTQALVTYKCIQGTFHACVEDSTCATHQ